MVDDERGGNVAIIGDADEHLPLLHGPAQERIARVLVMLPEDIEIRPAHFLDHVVVEVHDSIHVRHRCLACQKKPHRIPLLFWERIGKSSL